MISLYNYIEEDAKGRLRATLAGLGGKFTLGDASVEIDMSKEQLAKETLGKMKDDILEMYNSGNEGKKMVLKWIASFPLLGAIATNIAYSKRQNAEEELAKEIGITVDELNTKKIKKKRKTNE